MPKKEKISTKKYEINREQIQSALEQAKSKLDPKHYKIFEDMLESVDAVANEDEEIRQLLKQVFDK